MEKNSSLIWNIALTVAVVVLFFLHFTGNKPGSGTGSGSSATTSDGRKLVYVQIDSLLTNYEYFKDARKELENKRFQLDNDLTTRGRSLENEIAFFQQKAQTMTLDQARNTEAQLMKKQQDFVQYRDRAAQTLAQEEADKNEELYNQIHEYLEKYNNENSYEFVLGYTRGGGILFADSALNVTDKVLDGLNKAYAEKGKKDDKSAKKDSTATKK